jgi:hypothetical protein
MFSGFGAFISKTGEGAGSFPNAKMNYAFSSE